jgi:hypothetical protein
MVHGPGAEGWGATTGSSELGAGSRVLPMRREREEGVRGNEWGAVTRQGARARRTGVGCAAVHPDARSGGRRSPTVPTGVAPGGHVKSRHGWRRRVQVHSRETNQPGPRYCPSPTNQYPIGRLQSSCTNCKWATPTPYLGNKLARQT